jgi:hypothetical protein
MDAPPAARNVLRHHAKRPTHRPSPVHQGQVGNVVFKNGKATLDTVYGKILVQKTVIGHSN